ncbi:NU5M oxidoreductase, partial [Acromyrmex charruanus]
GMCSYCLVIYYHNYISYNSGMVTVLCNRIGDVGILILGLILLIMLETITKGLKFSFLYILVHTIFKSMLFMASGSVIHSMKNTQYIQLLRNLNEVIPYVIIKLLISSIALRDVPFISGFYRKGIIIEIIYRVNMFILIIISLLLSYSVQLFYYLFFNKRLKFYRYINIKEYILINVPIIIMICKNYRAVGFFILIII